ncbi:MAG: ATP-binding protein [Bacillales bacterium]|jgi:AAA15 family ATPase/GTPase|nr:ATP-binding protein [Bacillales bacterium]
MLKQITLTNFLSFRDKTIIDLSVLNKNILKQNYNKNILKGLLLVGGNSSGKTNIFRALKLLIDAIYKKVTIPLKEYLCVFNTKSFYELEYDFLIGSESYNYLIRVNEKNEILKETLSKGSDIILSRAKNTASINNEPTEEDLPLGELYLRKIVKDPSLKKDLNAPKFLAFLNNIVLVSARKDTITSYSGNPLELKEYLRIKGVKPINDFLSANNIDLQIIYSDEGIFIKKTVNAKPVSLKYESTGVQALLRLLVLFFNAFANNSILIIDEFSSNFHNQLEELLIEYFFNQASSAQLLLTSHSTNILKMHLFKMEQIYSVYLTGAGSQVYRFSNYPIRESQNLEKVYLSGALNGISNLDKK